MESFKTFYEIVDKCIDEKKYDEVVEVLKQNPTLHMKDGKGLDRLLAKCEQISWYDLIKQIMVILLDNSFFFNQIHYFDVLKPLIAAGDYSLPVLVTHRMIGNKFSGFASEWSSLETLIVSLLKDESFSLDECMNLIIEVTKIPDVLNTNFIIKILKGLRRRKAWPEYKKYIFMHENCLDAWNDLIEWTVEKSGPSINESLDCLIKYKQDSPIQDHGV